MIRILTTPSILRLVDERKLTDGRWSDVLDFYLGEENHNISVDRINAVVQVSTVELGYNVIKGT
jgi:hypothetical protein